MHRHDPRTRDRRSRFTIVLSLLIGSLAVLAASVPAPRTEGTVHARVAEPAPAIATAASEVRTRRPASVSRRPAPDPPFPSGHSRAAVPLDQPLAGVVPRMPAGAKVVFLGDSYTSGMNGAGVGRRGWPALVGEARDWRIVNLAVAGTGFINPGWTNQPIGSRIATAIRRRPDIVFVAAGHNDSRWSAAVTARAANRVIDRLRHALPDAVLVIVAPIWSSGNPPRRCLDLRDHLRRTARSVDAIFIDPLAEGWFAGSRRRLIGPDGIHPTDAGHRYMARRVLAAIAAAE